jgi:hypothetical protein
VLKKGFHFSQQEKFRYRSEEMLRIEALSDAVFAFSVSLLVASLEVPQTFHELQTIIYGAIPFFTTVALIFLLWYQQYIFFRHYALNDLLTILFNLAYLSVILFYVYPLKFLFSLLISSWTGIDLFPKASEKGLFIILPEDFPSLIIIFGTGYFFVWLLLWLMHKHALNFSEKLRLDKYELAYTHKEKRGALWNCFIAIASVICAAFGLTLLSGIMYLFIPILLIINQKIFVQQLKKPANRKNSHSNR